VTSKSEYKIAFVPVQPRAGLRFETFLSRTQLGVMLRLFVLMMPVAEAKEPSIAGSAAIRVLKQHMAKEPIFGTGSSRTEELFATAIGTTRDLSLRSGFVHEKILDWEVLSYNDRGLVISSTSLSAEFALPPSSRIAGISWSESSALSSSLAAPTPCNNSCSASSAPNVIARIFAPFDKPFTLVGAMLSLSARCTSRMIKSGCSSAVF
jgi:hypothetical protein